MSLLAVMAVNFTSIIDIHHDNAHQCNACIDQLLLPSTVIHNQQKIIHQNIQSIKQKSIANYLQTAWMHKRAPPNA